MKAKRKAHQKGKTARRRKTTRRMVDLQSVTAPTIFYREPVKQLTLEELQAISKKALGQAPENK